MNGANRFWITVMVAVVLFTLYFTFRDHVITKDDRALLVIVLTIFCVFDLLNNALRLINDKKMLILSPVTLLIVGSWYLCEKIPKLNKWLDKNL